MSSALAPYKGGESTLVLNQKRVAVFTDLHLQPAKPGEIQYFAHSLLGLVGTCQSLVVLGDLFESYIGREDFLHPAFDPLCAALGALRDAACSVILVRGNRDVLLSSTDGKRLGFQVADSVLCTAVPGNLLLTHGDAFCLGDLPYQRLRRILRTPGVRPFLRALPRWLRWRLARSLRRYSQAEVARKPLDSMHLTLSAVEAAMAEEDAQVAWIGHLHRAERHDLSASRRLQVLPAWEPGDSPHWITEKLDETV